MKLRMYKYDTKDDQFGYITTLSEDNDELCQEIVTEKTYDKLLERFKNNNKFTIRSHKEQLSILKGCDTMITIHIIRETNDTTTTTTQ